MTRKIETVGVLGCGTMGSGIAAVAAAAGCRVVMLDVTNESATAGLAAIEDEDRDRVEVGTFEADLAKLAEADWIVEAIVEDLSTKRLLFERVEAVRSDGSIVTTNTSGIPLRDIIEGMGDRLAADAAVTHFFNPAKVMKLFEVVAGDGTSPDVIETLADFATNRLGKGVVYAKDTANFIGNRIGCFYLLSALHKAKPFLAEGMTQETVDGVLGQPVGLPPTGLYGLIDLIGLDVLDLVARNLAANLPVDDVGRAFAVLPELEQQMLQRGQLGRKSGGGFTKVTKHEDGSRTNETFDLVTEDWRLRSEPDLAGVPSGLGDVLFADTDHGRLAWDVFGGALRYAAGLVPEISDDIVNIDRAMRWGFNWTMGPFELLDVVGADRVIAKIEHEGGELPAMLGVLADVGAAGFYRHDGAQFLGRDGTWGDID